MVDCGGHTLRNCFTFRRRIFGVCGGGHRLQSSCVRRATRASNTHTHTHTQVNCVNKGPETRDCGTCFQPPGVFGDAPATPPTAAALIRLCQTRTVGGQRKCRKCAQNFPIVSAPPSSSLNTLMSLQRLLLPRQSCRMFE